MSTDVFSDLKSYYIQVAQNLIAEAKQAALLVNPTGVGTEREEAYRDFLDRHLPKTCDVFLGGYVFDRERKRFQTDRCDSDFHQYTYFPIVQPVSKHRATGRDNSCRRDQNRN